MRDISLQQAHSLEGHTTQGADTNVDGLFAMRLASGRFLAAFLVSTQGLSVALLPHAGTGSPLASQGHALQWDGPALTSMDALAGAGHHMGSIHLSPNHPAAFSPDSWRGYKVSTDSTSFQAACTQINLCNKPDLCMAAFLLSLSSCSTTSYPGRPSLTHHLN